MSLTQLGPGVVDLSGIVPVDRLVPVYHSPGCRGVAFYLTRRPFIGEGISSEMVRKPDGTRVEKNSMVICYACGKPIVADHLTAVMKGLTLEKPKAPRARKKKS